MRASKVRKIYIPNGALAKWAIIEIRCRSLNENFYAAVCQNKNCNIGDYDITKPDNIVLESKPIFASRHVSGMNQNKTVLVPIACSCQAKQI